MPKKFYKIGRRLCQQILDKLKNSGFLSEMSESELKNFKTLTADENQETVLRKRFQRHLRRAAQHREDPQRNTPQASFRVSHTYVW
jgi:hypothetical protein